MDIEVTPASTYLTAQVTFMQPGRMDAYRRAHAEIPAPLAALLQECGVVSWRIWQYGDDMLFHAIETREGLDAFLAAIEPHPPVDPAWDEMIATLGEPGNTLLPHVWSMDAGGQKPGWAPGDEWVIGGASPVMGS